MSFSTTSASVPMQKSMSAPFRSLSGVSSGSSSGPSRQGSAASDGTTPRLRVGDSSHGKIHTLKASFGFLKAVPPTTPEAIQAAASPDAVAADNIFFHFSELRHIAPEEVQLGDDCVFTLTLDRKTARPVAHNVFVIKSTRQNGASAPHSSALSDENVSEVFFTGIVSRSPALGKPPLDRSTALAPDSGRIKCDDRTAVPDGYISFSSGDQANPSDVIAIGEEVRFRTAQHKDTLRLKAVQVEKGSAPLDRHLGFVVVLKDSFGFMERLDTQGHIFFHFSAVEGPRPRLGDVAEYNIDNHRGKLVAVNVSVNNSGERPDMFRIVRRNCRGVVLAMIAQAADQASNTKVQQIGTIKFLDEDVSANTIAFDNLDLTGPHTVFNRINKDDIVTFDVAIDKRPGDDRRERAVNIRVVGHQEPDYDQNREQGYIIKVKEAYGFIRCMSRDQPMFFHFSELPQNAPLPQVGQEVDFTVAPVVEPGRADGGSDGRVNATRIRYLPKGTIVDRSRERTQGTIVSLSKSELANGVRCAGELSFDQDGRAQRMPFQMIRATLSVGDVVSFNVMTEPRTRVSYATNLKIEKRNFFQQNLFGAISDIKDAYGFIEMPSGTQEVFFHQTEVQGPLDQLRVGQRVSFDTVKNNNEEQAVNVTCVDPDKDQRIAVLDSETRTGTVIQELRRHGGYGGRIEYLPNSAQEPDADTGAADLLLGLLNDLAQPETLPFGIADLEDPSNQPCLDDKVTFRIATDVANNRQFATRIRLANERQRETHTARVLDFLDNSYGFIDFKLEGSKQGGLFFHISSVTDRQRLKPNDKVSFQVTYSKKDKKYSATKVTLVESAPEPAASSDDSSSFPGLSVLSPKMMARARDKNRAAIVIRQPHGPDPDSKGFSRPRTIRSSRIA